MTLIIILLTIIAIGVLLLSEAGRGILTFLSWAVAILIVLGILFLGVVFSIDWWKGTTMENRACIIMILCFILIVIFLGFLSHFAKRYATHLLEESDNPKIKQVAKTIIKICEKCEKWNENR